MQSVNLTAKFTYFSHSLDVRILISSKTLHSVTSEILVKFDIFDASISSVKYFRISLNLASEILERTIYLFLAQDKLKTFKGVFLKESASTRTMILSMKNKYIYRS